MFGFNEFREGLLVLISTPVYAVVIGAEIFFSNYHKHKEYSKRGTIENIYLMFLNMGLDILMRGVCLYVLNYFFQFRFFQLENKWMYWIMLLITQDFMFYLLHYVDHYVRFFWAVHITHHSSEEFNLTVGFRSSVFQPLYRFAYFIPLSLIGFYGKDIMFMYSATQIYGILIHTKYINKLGFLEWFMSTPSHHRVHHASNALYLDKNMGMVFIIWDKLFGTFVPEQENEKVRYGLTENISSHNPANVVFHEWRNIFKDVGKSPKFKHKFMYVFGPPGWSHDGSKKTSRQLREEWLQNHQ
ncbi:MAG TPA: sterol desaturase family protein [Bacteroidia bacterium]|jgi:sterol desaturase/sphingolipid hydroxylase (fatty acid hydroxylase superfamily)|nr:sterol desaturase family protein [Bacteroidia bacterium]